MICDEADCEDVVACAETPCGAKATIITIKITDPGIILATKIAVLRGSTNTNHSVREGNLKVDFDPGVLPRDVSWCFVSVVFIRFYVT